MAQRLLMLFTRHSESVGRKIIRREDAMPFGLHTKDTPGKGRILIVDDEASIRKALCLTLAKVGYDVVESDDGATGIAAIGADDNPLMVDVVICDIRMPKVNGLEAIAYFRRQYPSVPVIVLTGYPDIHLATSLLKQGVVDYLVKPVERDKLVACVERAMERRTALVQHH
jgi:two-component system chemotaxis response regulator CheY